MTLSPESPHRKQSMNDEQVGKGMKKAVFVSLGNQELIRPVYVRQYVTERNLTWATVATAGHLGG